jgi:hypothetical protein
MRRGSGGFATNAHRACGLADHFGKTRNLSKPPSYGKSAMPKLNWIPTDDGNTLAADGYPIRIKRTHGVPPFKLETDRHVPDAGYCSLDLAKVDAERFAAEMDEFCLMVK